MVVLPVVTDWQHVEAISRSPITNLQYRRITTGLQPLGAIFDKEVMAWVDGFEPWIDPRFNADDQPVVCVSYKDALEFCECLTRDCAGEEPPFWNAGPLSVQLPTTRVWDLAAFGNSSPFSVMSSRADRTGARFPGIQQLIHQKAEFTAAVSDDPSRRNALGVSDLFGNVWEWCLREDHWRNDSHSRISLGLEPFPISVPALLGERSDFASRRRREATQTGLRGGGYLDDLASIRPTLSAREITDGVDTRHSDLGFRVATSLLLSSLPRDAQDLVREHQLGGAQERSAIGVPSLTREREGEV
jgi:formylglycine-generating enzyme required for sulfatase activity